METAPNFCTFSKIWSTSTGNTDFDVNSPGAQLGLGIPHQQPHPWRLHLPHNMCTIPAKQSKSVPCYQNLDRINVRSCENIVMSVSVHSTSVPSRSPLQESPYNDEAWFHLSSSQRGIARHSYGEFSPEMRASRCAEEIVWE